MAEPKDISLTGTLTIDAAAQADAGQPPRSRRFTMLAYTGGAMRITIGADKVLATHVKDGEALPVGLAVPDTKEVTFGTSKLARDGNNVIATLPTSDPAVAGALYVDNGVVKVSAGA